MLDPNKTIDIDEQEFDKNQIYRNDFFNSTEYKLWFEEGEGFKTFADAFIAFFTPFFRSKGIDINYIECHDMGLRGFRGKRGFYRFNFRTEKDALLFRLKIQS